MTQLESRPTARDRLEVSPRKATAADVPALTGVIARAFDDDPFINWFVAQDGKRAQRIHNMMGVALRKMTLPFGEVYTSDGLQGGALWTPPGKWKLGLLQQFMLIPDMARSVTLRRLPKVMSGVNGVEKKHPQTSHYYLMVLGVEPSLQGRGVGTQLMAPILERCDRERVPAYLETATERNLPLYQRKGFKVTEEHTIKDGPKVWMMWREPK